MRLATWQSAHRMLSTTPSAGVPGRLAKLMSAVAAVNVVTISSAVSAALSIHPRMSVPISTDMTTSTTDCGGKIAPTSK